MGVPSSELTRAAAQGSSSAPLPFLSQPRARAPPLLLGSGRSPFEATRQPSSGRPGTEDLRPNSLTGVRSDLQPIIAQLRAHGGKVGATVVYCPTKKMVEEVSALLTLTLTRRVTLLSDRP